MNLKGVLTAPLLEAVQAIGLVSASGEPDATWFNHPLHHIASMLTDNNQRSALFSLFDGVLPAQPVTGAPAGSKWHPLLGAQTAGNLYLTIDDAGATTVIGFAGRYAGRAASLVVEVPLLSLRGGKLSAVAGTASGPVQLSVDVDVGWTTPAHPVGLQSMSLAVVYAPEASPPVANVVTTLRGLDLDDGTGARDVTLDPADPATVRGEAVWLIIGLIREKLHEIASTATGDAAAIVKHLIACWAWMARCRLSRSPRWPPIRRR